MHISRCRSVTVASNDTFCRVEFGVAPSVDESLLQAPGCTGVILMAGVPFPGMSEWAIGSSIGY